MRRSFFLSCPIRLCAILCLAFLLLLQNAAGAAPRTDTTKTEAFTIIQRSDNYRINISYPAIGNTVADTELAIWARGQASIFTRGIEDIPSSFPYELTITYTVQNASPRVASVIFIVSTFMGGVHPEPGLATFVYDLNNGRRLSYSNIFHTMDKLLPFLSQYCRKSLTEQLGEKADKDMIEAGTSENMENFDLFSLDSSGLVVHFAPYQVAPYSDGYQRVRIPLEALKPFSPYLPFWGKAPAS